MVKSFEDLKRDHVFRIRIVLSEAWSKIIEPTDEDRRLAELHDGLWVEFKEPSIAEANALRAIKEDQITGALNMMPVHLVAHNLVNADGSALTEKAVVDYIASSANLFYHVFYTWLQSLPLTRRNAGKSAT
jgi:hypothetical protein